MAPLGVDAMALGVGGTGIDVAAVAADFPLLARRIDGNRLVFLDSAASSQKPRSVIDAMSRYYETTHANVHRGVYRVAEEATAAYESARAGVARFIGASGPRGVVFTKNATEAVNLVARTWGAQNLSPGSTKANRAVLLTEMEHHANLVPWMMLRDALGVELRFLPIDDEGNLILTDLDRMLDGVGLVGVTAASNVLGTINPVRLIADAAHAAGAVTLVDGAQSVPHMPTDVEALGCDFLVFSSHKMCGPTGIGVLWAREELLESMPAFLGGGEMILDVRLDGWVPNEIPWRFEAGTPPIAEAVGLSAAVDYLEALGMERVRAHERDLVGYALATLAANHGEAMKIYGPADVDHRGGVVAFTFESALGHSVHPHDLAQVLDHRGVCVRAGHHCAKPLMRRLGVSATARASFYLYSDTADVDALSEALFAASDLFAGV